MTTPPFVLASQHFAKRILHESEYTEWRARFDNKRADPTSMTPAEVTWLATRWTIKEAAFKSLPNHLMRLSWHDAIVQKVNGKPVVHPTAKVLSEWKKAGLQQEFPKMHVSITHDGDYATAYIIAESKD
jgi:holo-[acyl-carrier protein] synthase